MTGRALAVQGGLAVLGLLTVYATWQREPERAPGAVTVIDASKSDVTLVRYKDESTTVDLTPGKTGDEDGVWLHLVTKPKPEAKPDPKAGSEADRQAGDAARAAPARRAICRAPTTPSISTSSSRRWCRCAPSACWTPPSSRSWASTTRSARSR